jgi:FkbM family methyltransferase
MPFTPYIAKDRAFHDFRFDFYIANEVGKQWYDGGVDQRMPEREWCVSQLQRGMNVVDCGAHHGMLSLIFANAIGTSGKVFAYEALPTNAAIIQRNAALNAIDNIIVRPVGVGDSPALMAVQYNLSNTLVIGGAPPPDQDINDFVQIVRLDDDLPNDMNIDFLKIDVEGYDLNALRGMERTLAQHPILDLELHNFLFADRSSTLEQIVSILRPLDYNWDLLGEIGDKPNHLTGTLAVHHLVDFSNPHLMGVPIAH